MVWHSYKVQNPTLSMRFWKRKHKVLHHRRNSHSCQHRMGTNQLKSCSAKKGLGILAEMLSLASNVPLWHRSAMASWVASGRASPALGQGRWSLPSPQHWWGISRVLSPLLGFLVQKGHRFTGIRDLSYEERAGNVQLGE